MLRLLFCSAALLPIGIVPWMTSEADVMSEIMTTQTYAERVTDPSIDALSDCDVGELPVYFMDDLITSHSAEFIAEGFTAAEGCGSFDITIIPVLPKSAGDVEKSHSAQQTAELSAYIQDAANISRVDVRIDVADFPREDDISTLYMNGRAAILRIDPQSRIG